MYLSTLSKALLILMLLFAISCKDDDGGSGGTDTSTDTATDSSTDTASTVTDTNSSVNDTATDTATASDSAVTDTASVTDTTTDTATVVDTASDTATAIDTNTDTPTDSGTDTDTGTEPIDAATALNHLITVFCEWEFSCCTQGERAYRLGMGTAENTAADCVELLTYELNESNDTNIPLHLTQTGAMAIVPQIAYTVDLDRVTVNAEGVAACATWLDTLECNQPVDPAASTSCEEGVSAADANPCALSKMFNPGLMEGDVCTNDTALFEGAFNDIECELGTTCIPPGDPGNNTDQALCINRGLDGDPCHVSGSKDNCDFNLYCAADNHCTPKAEAGEACSYANLNRPEPGDLAIPCKPGLSCNPILDDSSNGAGLCVAACSTGSLCEVDSQCPAGQSCAPANVGNDSTGFSVCRPLGSDATHRCGSHDDCVPTSYCNAQGVCAADSAISGSCTEDAQCPDGTFCDTGTCTAFTQNGTACTRDPETFEAPECGPTAVGCIYDEDAGETICSTAKVANGAACEEDYDCASGLCEQLTADGVPEDMVCYAGAAAGDACDDIPASFVASRTRCAPGLECDADTNLCYALLGPGANCEAEAGGVADDMVCATTCEDTWGEFMCSDGPVDILDGGTGLVCDGSAQ